VAAKILIVESDLDSLLHFEQVLGEGGDVVRGARTYSEAVRALSSFTPDLLITEVRLSEHNGLNLFLQARGRDSTLPCIIVSAYADVVLKREAVEHGVFAFLVKPLDAQTLNQQVVAALASRGQRRWPRKAVQHQLHARVEGQPARILDVSYGGVRLELPFEAFVGLPVEIDIEEFAYPLRANTVWIQGSDGRTQVCGAVLKMDDHASSAWHSLVDAQ
jgi:DNA-binding NtrC family response regulator